MTCAQGLLRLLWGGGGEVGVLRDWEWRSLREAVSQASKPASLAVISSKGKATIQDELQDHSYHAYFGKVSAAFRSERGDCYIQFLSSTTSKKYAYVDNLSLLHSCGSWKALEGALSQDMAALSKLKLSHAEMVTAAFHLHNREAERELIIYANGLLLPVPTYSC